MQLSFAQSDLELSAKRALTDLNALSSFVTQASICYDQIDLEGYRKHFCENQKDHLFNFETLTQELTQLKDANFEKWLKKSQGKKPEAPYASSLELIDLFYQECRAYDSAPAEVFDDAPNDLYVEEDFDQAPVEYESLEPPVKEISALESLFPPNADGDISFNANDYNNMIASIESYTEVLADPKKRSLVEQARVQGLKLRREILLSDPLLLNFALTQTPDYDESVETTFRLFQEQTGISPDQIPEESKKFYQLFREYRKASDELVKEGYRHPQDHQPTFESEFVIQKNESGEFSLTRNDSSKMLPDQRPAYSAQMLIEKIGWGRDDLIENINIATSTTNTLKTQTELEEAIGLVSQKYSSQIQKWKDDVEKIEQIYRETVSENQSFVDEIVTEDGEEDFCEREKKNLLRNFSDQETVVSFFEDQKNRDFMRSSFNKSRDLMKETLKDLNLSSESKEGMVEILNDVQFHLPEYKKSEWSDLQSQTTRLMKLLKEEGVREDIYMAHDEAKKYLKEQKEYKPYFEMEKFDSTNAFYLPHSEDGHSHKVGATCGIALPSIQENYPEFYMGVIAHELGHAMDPGFSSPNRERYSQESLATMDDLRECLIKNNQGNHLRVSEDFADHLESHFMAHWMKSTQEDPKWPLLRQRYLHFSYSSICLEDEIKMSSHSDNDYRARHVLSHPVVAQEFSEMSLPPVPFCSELLPKNTGTGR